MITFPATPQGIRDLIAAADETNESLILIIKDPQPLPGEDPPTYKARISGTKVIMANFFNHSLMDPRLGTPKMVLSFSYDHLELLLVRPDLLACIDSIIWNNLYLD